MDNPEFRRQVWLELTPHRLVAMPVLLGLLFAFIHLSFEAAGGSGRSAVAGIALWGFGGLLLLWGTRLAADSVTDEVRGHTWDQQRMSALPPWQLAWGKLVGGPIYPWYGALWCSAAFLIASEGPLAHSLSKLVLLGSLALMLHGLALLAALLAARKGSALPQRGQSAMPLLAVFIALPVLQIALSEMARTTPVHWFGLATSVFGAALVSTVLFAGWSLVGVHRLMRAELQERNTPAIWLAFLVFVMAWAAGFVPRELGQGDPQTALTPTRLLVAYAVAHAAIYVLVFAERKEPAVFRRLLRFRRLGQRDRLLDELPLWLVSVPIAGLAAAALLLQAPAVVSAAQKQLVAGLVLLLARDLSLVLGLAFGRGARRSELAGVIYLFALYALAPGIALQTGLEDLRGFFWPRTDVAPAAALVPLALEAVGFALFAWLRWRRAAADWPDDDD